MAKQKGIHSMSGTVDGLTYYQSAEGALLVKKKSSLNKERVSKDPAFEKSRDASKEFGRASSASRIMRAAMPLVTKNFGEKLFYHRLTGFLQGVIATDTAHAKGERTLQDADLSRLVGFQWNKHQTFGNLYFGKPKFSIDAKSGLMEIDFDAINGPQDFDRPKSASHVQLVLEGGGFDFGLGEGVGVTDSTDWLSLKRKHPVQTLSGTLAVKPGMRLVLGVGIRFGEEVNDAIYELNNRLYRGFVVGAVV
jgi:hypothetical protein